jgi:hypothetical protein
MFTKLTKLGYSFVCDESGQGALEYSGMLMLGAVLAYFAYTQRTTLENAISGVMGRAATYLGDIQ